MDMFDQLHELRANLVRAQRAENEAIRNLGEFTAAAKADRARFKVLLNALHAAREKSVAAYDKWAEAVSVYQTGTVSDAQSARTEDGDALAAIDKKFAPARAAHAHPQA